MLISHAHWDHLDLRFARRGSARDVRIAIVPRGAGKLVLRRALRGGRRARPGRPHRDRRASRDRDPRRPRRRPRPARRPRARARLPDRGIEARLLRGRHRPVPRDGRARARSTSRCSRSRVGGRASARAISTRAAPPRRYGCSSRGSAVPIHWGTYSLLTGRAAERSAVRDAGGGVRAARRRARPRGGRASARRGRVARSHLTG